MWRRWETTVVKETDPLATLYTYYSDVNARLEVGLRFKGSADYDWYPIDLKKLLVLVVLEHPYVVDRLFGGLLGVDGCFAGAGVAFGIRKETDLHPIDIHLTRMMAKISFKYVKAEEAKGL